MTVLEFAAAHPWWSAVFVILTGNAVAGVVRAAVDPLRTWRRPGDCPRCHGTGREP
jgi:hypothetical protein